MEDRPEGGYDLAVLLLLALRSLIDDLHARLHLAGFNDVRPAHGFAFQLLAPHGATGADLAAHLGVTKQAASVMVDYLEEHGYVERRPDPRDGRGKIVVLTQRGWDCIRAVESILADIEQRWTDILGADRMSALHVDLRRIVVEAGAAHPPLRLRPIW